MVVKLRPHPEIELFLASDPRRHVFPLHVCQERPTARSPAVVGEGRVCGALVGGAAFGIAPVPSAWLVTEDEAAARLLLAHARETGRLDGLQLPWRWASLVNEGCPGFQVTRDRYLTRRPGPDPAVPQVGELVPIEAGALARVDVPAELRRSLGPLGEFPPDRFWGLAVDGRLVALTDAIVRYGDVVTLQQVYCLPELRRQGYTRALVAAVLAHPAVAGRVATWLCAEDNTASLGLARGLSFGEDEVLGCVTRLP